MITPGQKVPLWWIAGQAVIALALLYALAGMLRGC